MASVTCWTNSELFRLGGIAVTNGGTAWVLQKARYAVPPLTPQISVDAFHRPAGGPWSVACCPRNTIASSKRAKTFAARRNICSALVKLGSAIWAPRSHTFTCNVLRGKVLLSSTHIRSGSEESVPGLFLYFNLSGSHEVRVWRQRAEKRQEGRGHSSATGFLLNRLRDERPLLIGPRHLRISRGHANTPG